MGSSPITHPILWLRAGASAPAFPTLSLGCSQVVRHGTLTPAFVGSSPTIPAKAGKRGAIAAGWPPRPQPWWPPRGPAKAMPRAHDPLAQLVEQRPFKAKVRGSSPRRVTTKKDTTSVVSFFVSSADCLGPLHPPGFRALRGGCIHPVPEPPSFFVFFLTNSARSAILRGQANHPRGVAAPGR